MVANTDYGAIDPPPEKSPTEYSYVERRAEILQLIEQQGHPHGFNKSELGRRYGVSHEQIRKDFERLKEYYQTQIGDIAKVQSELAYRKIIREHLSNGDYEKARRALDSWNGWLFDIGAQEKTPDKHEHQHGSLEEAFMADLRRAASEEDDE